MAESRKPAAGLSQLPEQQRTRVRKAPTQKSGTRPVVKNGEPDAGEGPGGLGYVLGLDDSERSEIDWHATEKEPKAPPTRNPRKR